MHWLTGDIEEDSFDHLGNAGEIGIELPAHFGSTERVGEHDEFGWRAAFHLARTALEGARRAETSKTDARASDWPVAVGDADAKGLGQELSGHGFLAVAAE